MIEPATIPPLGRFAAAWGVTGVLLLLLQATVRLGGYASEALRGAESFSPLQWTVLLGWTAISLHAEGYRAFHQKFSPRVVARALHLAQHPQGLHVALAPLFCMCFFHATRKGKIVAWSITAMVLCFIVLLRMTPQPWRGIVDTGVVSALGVGQLSILYHAARAWRTGTPPDVPTQLPELALSAG